jgi:uncharacterized membrane protein YtjA (UPF0391 family)
MLRWVIAFLILAMIAAFFGFGGVAGVSMNAAYIIGFIAVVLIVLGFAFGRGGPSVDV